MGTELLPEFIREHYEVHEWKHACAILYQDFPSEWADLVELLTQFRLQRSHLVKGGGRKSKVSESIDAFLFARGWAERKRPVSTPCRRSTVVISRALPSGAAATSRYRVRA